MRPPRGEREGDRLELEMLRAWLAEVERQATPKERPATPEGSPATPKGRRKKVQVLRRREAGSDDPPIDDPPIDEPFDGEPLDDEPFDDDPPIDDPLDDEPAGEPEEGVPPGRESTRGARGPQPLAGGLAARTLRGPAGATWWSRRFLGSLESAMAGGRMAHGRAYARRGQVAGLVVGPGVVAAAVQGSREEPYAIRLEIPVVPDEDWDRILEALATRAEYAARMLAGELPEEVEQVFESEGASLLPAPHARLVSECTCVGWENPCAHVAAVCYLLAEELDRDPFALLAWRGRGKAEVLGELRARRRRLAAAPPVTDPPPGAGASELPPGVAGACAGTPAGTGATQSGPGGRDAVDRFWVAGPELAHVRARPEEAAMPAAALRLAPRGTIKARGGDLADVLVPAYHAIVAAAAARSRR